MTEERIFPFLWMREGDTDRIEEEIHKIYDTGARASNRARTKVFAAKAGGGIWISSCARPKNWA